MLMVMGSESAHNQKGHNPIETDIAITETSLAIHNMNSCIAADYTK